MKKLIALTLIATTLSFTTSNTNQKGNSYVYICVSKTAKKYHYNKYCRGLNNCTHTIKEVSLTSARNDYKRTLCGWED